jgi:trans-2,3-dihydro-3-hydroxyanthranilate isomerase
MELPFAGHPTLGSAFVLADASPRETLFVELPSVEEVRTLRPDMGRLAALGSTAFSVFARNGARWKTRVFAPGEGIPEDPATGAAAGPHALHLARYGHIRFGDEVVIEQGAEIGRPSTLHARAVGSAHRLEQVEVGGSAVVVAQGEFRSLRTAAGPG